MSTTQAPANQAATSALDRRCIKCPAPGTTARHLGDTTYQRMWGCTVCAFTWTQQRPDDAALQKG